MSIGGDVTGRPGGPQTSFWVPEAKELVSKRLIDQREGKPGYQRVESATEMRQLAESTT